MSPLESLVACGTKLWLDSVDPDEVKRNLAFGATGATSNPIIVSDLIQTGRFDSDIAQLIDDRSATIRKFLVVPIGFVCDHTEILFDIDVQAARIAREFATMLRRTESLNTSPLFIATLEDLVRSRL